MEAIGVSKSYKSGTVFKMNNAGSLTILLLLVLLFPALPAAATCEFRMDSWDISIGSISCIGGPLIVAEHALWSYLGSTPVYQSTAFVSGTGVNVHIYESPKRLFTVDQLKEIGKILAANSITVAGSNVVTDNGVPYFIARGELRLAGGIGMGDSYVVATPLNDYTMIVFDGTSREVAAAAAKSCRAQKTGLTMETGQEYLDGNDEFDP